MLAYVIVGVIAILSPVIGYFLGAVRTFTCFVGAIVGIFTAPMLSAQIKGLLPKIKITDPFWQDFFGPGIAYLIILLVFFGIGFAVHMVPANYYRTRKDEVTRLKWLKVMQKSGAVVGVVTGLVVLVATSHLVSAFAYPATLLSSSSLPKGVDKLADTYDGFQKVGLTKISAGFDGKSDDYYKLLDAIATIYHNSGNDVLHRLSAYPPFLTKLKQDPNYSAIASDSKIKEIFSKQGSFLELYANENVQAAIADFPIEEELKEIDLDDLVAFLKTGVSKKYNTNKVVGRWQLDAGQTSREMVPEMNQISRSILPVVRKAFPDVKVNFTATLDGDFSAAISIPEGKIKQYLAEQAQGNKREIRKLNRPVIQTRPADDSGDSYNPEPNNRDFQNAYGTNAPGGGGGGGGTANQEEFQRNMDAQNRLIAQRNRQKSSNAIDPSIEIRKLMSAFARNTSGTWTKDGYKYILKFNSGQTLEALVVDNDLKIIDGSKKYIFYPNL